MRSLAFFVGLFLCLAIEYRAPTRRRVHPALRHDATNLLLGGINALLTALFGLWAARTLSRPVGLFHEVGAVWNVVLSLIALDLFTYLLHIAFHRVPWLWRLHRVHHTDRDLNATSAVRFHPGEILVSALLRLGFVVLWGATWYAVAIFEGVLVAAAQFQHGNFRLPAPVEAITRRLFVTPDMHRIHHSDVPAETNSNYATIFSCWDRLFKTDCRRPQEGLVIGLRAYPHWVSIGELMRIPFCRGE
jgi:sterol desaturase/sphingolipid hydroxylase (fatty acid hydroxylase superfamily)